jgi:aryl-alcohol dehydrogenase-like predicted oxidoreductase
MQTEPFAGYQISPLMLGTVQFGLPYGVANRTGQPAYGEVRAILAAALDGGVTCFDTAATYGASEEVARASPSRHLDLAKHFCFADSHLATIERDISAT